jgi:hypothetical protein
MTDAVIEYRDEDTGTVFRWHGGAYIDVGYYGDGLSRGIDMLEGEFHAVDVINVWDDERDRSVYEVKAAMELVRPVRIFRYVLEQFEEDCRNYLAEASKDGDDNEH